MIQYTTKQFLKRDSASGNRCHHALHLAIPLLYLVCYTLLHLVLKCFKTQQPTWANIHEETTSQRTWGTWCAWGTWTLANVPVASVQATKRYGDRKIGKYCQYIDTSEKGGTKTGVLLGVAIWVGRTILQVYLCKTLCVPVVPHKTVAEVSKIGNL